MFISYLCKGNDIALSGGNTISREDFSLMIVYLDSLCMVILCVFLLLMRSLVRREITATEQLLIEA